MRYALLTLILPCTLFVPAQPTTPDWLGESLSQDPVEETSSPEDILRNYEQAKLEPFRGMDSERVFFTVEIRSGDLQDAFVEKARNVLTACGLDLGWSSELDALLPVHLSLVATIHTLPIKWESGEATGMSSALVLLEIKQAGDFLRSLNAGEALQENPTAGDSHICNAIIYRDYTLMHYSSEVLEDKVIASIREIVDSLKIAVHSQNDSPTSADLIAELTAYWTEDGKE